MVLIDAPESLFFQSVIESSATSCEYAPRLLKQLSIVYFFVFSSKPRATKRPQARESSPSAVTSSFGNDGANGIFYAKKSLKITNKNTE